MSDTPKPMSETFNLPPGSFVRHIKEVEASGMSAEEVSMMGGIEGVLRFRLEQVAQLKDQLTALQARYDADIAMMNQRLIEQDANYLRRLQAKTQREGFVPVEVLREAVTRAGKGTMNGMETWHFRAEDVAIFQPYLNPNKEP